MEIGDHSRAGSISLRVESDYLQLEKVQPAHCWDDNTALFSLTKPPIPATGDPSVPATFTLDSASGNDTIRITVDISKPWCECIKVSPDWKMTQEDRPLSLEYRIQCRKLRQPAVEMVIRRGIVDQKSTVSLTVKSTQTKVNNPISRSKP
jgi:hypothetical protein